MAIYLGGKEVGILYEPTIKQQNINTYKSIDIENTTINGGELATDEEYAVAEVELQKMYSKIMGVENE